MLLRDELAAFFAEYNKALQLIDKRTGGQGASVVSADTLSQIFRYSVEVILKNSSRGKPIIGANDNAILDHLPVYDALFESPKMIAIFRNPVDAGISAWHHNLRLAKNEDPKHKNMMMRYGGFEGWVKQYARWFNGWVNAFHVFHDNNKNCILVRYEDLVNEKTRLLKYIFTFLCADASDKVVMDIAGSTSLESFKISSANPDFFRSGQVSFGQGEINDSLLKEIAVIAAAGLDYLGYDLESRSAAPANMMDFWRSPS